MWPGGNEEGKGTEQERRREKGGKGSDEEREGNQKIEWKGLQNNKEREDEGKGRMEKEMKGKTEQVETRKR